MSTGAFNTFVATTKARASQVNSNTSAMVNFFNTITSDILIGSAYQRLDSTATAHSMLSSDSIRALMVDVNTSAGYSLVLPTAAASAYKWLDLYNIGQTTGNLTLDGSGTEQIDNTTTISIPPPGSGGFPYGLGLFCNGTKWLTYNYNAPASATRPGLVSIGTQTFAGTKTFSGSNFRLAASSGGLGNDSTPYMTPSDDIDTGIFFPTANAIGIAAGGSQSFNCQAAGVMFNSTSTAAGAVDITADSATPGANEILTGRQSGGTVHFYSGNTNGAASGENGAAAIFKFAKDSSSSRSINAAGTINASGADYAEYMRKENVDDIFEKGEICGVTKDGLLTKSFSKAHSFVVKSTDPSYVGGDIWFSRRFETRKPRPPIAPKSPTLPADATSDVLSTYLYLVEIYNRDFEIYNKLKAQYEIDKLLYDKAWKEFNDDLESARLWVDRIAFSGQVPVLISGSAVAGDYIIPEQGANDSIIGKSYKQDAIGFPQYRLRIGKIWKVDQGKYTIAVGVS